MLNMVDRAMESGIPPQKIGYFAFTRKAANEAKERACKRFKLDSEVDLPYFRTLHSLAYRLLMVKDHQMMSKENWKEFSEAVGIRLTGSTSLDETDAMKASDHPMLQVINLARAMKKPLKQVYDSHPTYFDFSWPELLYVAQSYENYKQSFGVMDFHDLLQQFVQDADILLPEFELCFIDEAQDLSPIQWDIAHAIDAKSKRMYAAGDDDQAIFVWSGADVDHFINLTGDAEILEQSYRVPQAQHRLAEKVVNRISRRFPKRYIPRGEEGHVDHIRDIAQLDMSKGSWLILAQANFMLYDLYSELKQQGWLFERTDGSRSIPHKLAIAISGWERLRKGFQVPLSTAQAIYSYMSGNNVRVKRGHKVITALDDALFSLEDLQNNYGLLATEDMIWREAMDRIPELDSAYITNLLRSGEKFNAEPRIKLSTIHGAKGGEADNVVLLTDLTRAAMDQMNDDLHRVFYVGITRSRKNLYLLEPEDYSKAYLL
jgi:DNA helicase-2/ATP-dependent DNA helicase PcrA